MKVCYSALGHATMIESPNKNQHRHNNTIVAGATGTPTGLHTLKEYQKMEETGKETQKKDAGKEAVCYCWRPLLLKAVGVLCSVMHPFLINPSHHTE